MAFADFRRPTALAPLAGPVALSLIVVGVVYCQAHGALTGTSAPVRVSLWWSASGLLPSLVVLGVALRQAPRLRAQPVIGAVVLAVAFAAAIAVGEVAYAETLARLGAWTSALFRALPPGAGLSAAAVIGLLALAPAATAPSTSECAIPTDVALVRSAGNYVSVEVAGRERLIRLPLHEAARRLAPRGFVQAHRTALVNTARVAEVAREGRRLVLRLDDGRRVVVGRAYAAVVRSSLARRRSSQEL